MTEISDIDDESPYCKECSACGHDGCCSAVVCTQKGNCAYGESYLIDLKYGYQCWEVFANTVYDDLTDDIKQKVDAIRDEMYEKWYGKQTVTTEVNKNV